MGPKNPREDVQNPVPFSEPYWAPEEARCYWAGRRQNDCCVACLPTGTLLQSSRAR